MNAEGDYDAEVEVLFRKCHGRVLGHLINHGCDAGLAEEITNDAFLAVRRRWEEVSDPESYVFRVAKNERHRRQGRHDARAKELLPDPTAPSQSMNHGHEQDVVDQVVLRQALQRLPPRQREAVTCRYISDLSVAMTAEDMGISVGSVKRYTSEGLQRLRAQLTDSGPGEEGMARD